MVATTAVLKYKNTISGKRNTTYSVRRIDALTPIKSIGRLHISPRISGTSRSATLYGVTPTQKPHGARSYNMCTWIYYYILLFIILDYKTTAAFSFWAALAPNVIRLLLLLYHHRCYYYHYYFIKLWRYIYTLVYIYIYTQFEPTDVADDRPNNAIEFFSLTYQ